MTEPGFDDLPITERAREVAYAIGWKKPTPIQALVIPQLAARRDLIGRAETGSGKTGAFGLVLTDAVKAPGIQALVIAPTRELVLQITEDLNAMAAGAPFRAAAIYGGVPYDPQLAAIDDPATTCLVATTGRIMDLLIKRPKMLEGVRFVVIDEADRMLDLGFLPDVERLLALVPERQTALFTATMPKRIQQLAHRYLAHPKELAVGPASPVSAEHFRIDVPSQRKLEAFLLWLKEERPERALVFVRTREGAPKLAREIQGAGLASAAFHGDMDQAAREKVVRDFEAGRIPIVVATDVAARGLDIPGITTVVNYDVPEEAEQYVHRAGRTARAGKRGKVFTFVGENDGAHTIAAAKAAGVVFVRLDLYSEGERITKPASPNAVVRRGGNAKGVRTRKQTQGRPKGLQVEDEERLAPQRGEGYDLPPSRKTRD